MDITMERYVAEFISSIIRLPEVTQIVEETHHIPIEHLIKSILTGISLAAGSQNKTRSVFSSGDDQKSPAESQKEYIPSTSNHKSTTLTSDNDSIASYTSPESNSDTEYEAEPDKKPKAKVKFDTDSDTESEYEAEHDKNSKAKFNEDLTTMPVAELKAKCRSLGLPVSGTKQKLIQRLESSNQTGKTISSEENLEKLPLAALKEKCRNLGLPVTGTKQKLIQRLQAGKDVNLDQVKELRTRSVSLKKKSPEKKTYDVNYGILTVNELKKWCKRLGLNPVGNKQELIDRIAEYKKNEPSPDLIAEFRKSIISPDKAVNYRKNQTSSETDTSDDEDDFAKLPQNTKNTSDKGEYFFDKHLWNL